MSSLEGLVPYGESVRPTGPWANLPLCVSEDDYRFKVETSAGFLLGFFTTKHAAKVVRDRYNNAANPAGMQHLRPIDNLAIVHRGIDHSKGETGHTRWDRVSGPGDLGVRFVRVAL